MRCFLAGTRADRRGRVGFTLIELLVIIAILGLLMGILVPSLGQARDLARRASCGTNVGNICKALFQWDISGKGAYPAYDLNGGSCTVAIGTNGGSTAAGSRANTANLFALCRKGLAEPALFICPSTEHTAYEGGADGRSDFPGRENVSYGYQVPYDDPWDVDGESDGAPIRALTPDDVVLVADRNPHMNDNGSWPGSSTVSEPGKNSPNHGGDGQAIGRKDGSGHWASTPTAGHNDDNIYTAASGSDATSKTGSLGGPNSKYDSMIAP
jgi:type II secretory pathway pseudopilin PulG